MKQYKVCDLLHLLSYNSEDPQRYVIYEGHNEEYNGYTIDKQSFVLICENVLQDFEVSDYQFIVFGSFSQKYFREYEKYSNEFYVFLK
jgi:hypothetical protein